MDKTKVSLMCPKCGLSAEAHLGKEKYKFIIYTCPKCGSNVACYNNRVDVISDKLLGELIHSRKLRCCGNVMFAKKTSDEKEKALLSTDGGLTSNTEITPDKIANLRILLATENDFDKILSKL
jgi:peptide subunit release factor 1 (eRF1)